MGFSILLGNFAGPPSAPPLEVSLAELGQGLAGGSPGSGSGARGGGGGTGVGTVKPSPPGARSAAPDHEAVSSRRSAAPLQHPRVAAVAKAHRKRAPKPASIVDEKAAANMARVRAAAEDQLDADGTQPAQRKHEFLPSPSRSGATVPQPKTAEPGRSAVASLGGAGTASAPGSGGGADSADGAHAGAGAGDEGGGTGGGVGAGSQAYATVENPPVPISRVLPSYPSAARAQGVEGEVVLRAIVDQNGAVERDVVVVESVPLLDRAAIEALRQWRFEPGRDAANRAVRVVIEVPLRFRLR